eukprot:COSAG05_NODE_2006_length_3716_cov_1.634504_2_plen_83_part_00
MGWLWLFTIYDMIGYYPSEGEMVIIVVILKSRANLNHVIKIVISYRIVPYAGIRRGRKKEGKRASGIAYQVWAYAPRLREAP